MKSFFSILLTVGFVLALISRAAPPPAVSISGSHKGGSGGAELWTNDTAQSLIYLTPTNNTQGVVVDYDETNFSIFDGLLVSFDTNTMTPSLGFVFSSDGVTWAPWSSGAIGTVNNPMGTVNTAIANVSSAVSGEGNSLNLQASSLVSSKITLSIAGVLPGSRTTLYPNGQTTDLGSGFNQVFQWADGWFQGNMNVASSVFSTMTLATNGFLVKSNVLANLPILAPGDNFYWSSNGVAYVICCSSSGTLTTNKLGP